MAGSTTQKHLNSNYRLVGVFSSSTAYLADINRTALEGDTYYDKTDNVLKVYNGSSWVACSNVATSTGFAQSVALNPKATAAAEIEIADNANTVALTLDSDEATNNNNVLVITMAGTGNAIDFTSVGGKDIDGTASSWFVTYAGAATFGAVNLLDTIALNFGTSTDMSLAYAAANTLSLTQGVAGTGSVLIGVDGKGIDWTFYTETASSYFKVDQTNDRFVVAAANMCFGDASLLRFGTGTTYGGDIAFTYAGGTNILNIGQVASGTGTITIGADNKGIDVTFFGETASSFMIWDQNANTDGALVFDAADIMMGDVDKVIFGDSSDVTISWLAAGGLDIVAAGSTEIRFGADATGLDIIFYGDTAGTQLKWDQNGSTNGALLFVDSTGTWTFAEGTGALAVTATDVATSILTIGASGGTHGADLVWQPITSGDHVKFDAGAETATFTDVAVAMTGSSLNTALLTLTSNASTGDSMVISHKGSGDAIQITNTSATSVATRMIACAAQTTALCVFDAATNNWSGANDVGLLHATADAAFAHAGATLLYLGSSATPIAAAEGFLARFLDTGGATASTYAVEIASTNNGALNVSAGATAIGGTLAVTGVATMAARTVFTTGYRAGAVTVTPAADDGAGSIIALGTRFAVCAAVTNNNADWIILPSAAYPGQMVTVVAPAASNCEVRTPVGSSDKINNVDCSDGAAEYLLTATDVTTFINISAANWIAQRYTYLGAAGTAVVPDA